MVTSGPLSKAQYNERMMTITQAHCSSQPVAIGEACPSARKQARCKHYGVLRKRHSSPIIECKSM
eukprot:6464081-Amphidinium_carterae.1